MLSEIEREKEEPKKVKNMEQSLDVKENVLDFFLSDRGSVHITVQIGPNEYFFRFCREDAENYSNYRRPSRV